MKNENITIPRKGFTVELEMTVPSRFHSIRFTLEADVQALRNKELQELQMALGYYPCELAGCTGRRIYLVKQYIICGLEYWDAIAASFHHNPVGLLASLQDEQIFKSRFPLPS